MTTRTMVEGVTLEELEDDPYPIYARWRRETPVGYFEPVGRRVMVGDPEIAHRSSATLAEMDDCLRAIHRPRQALASFGYGLTYCSGHFIGKELERIMLEGGPHGVAGHAPGPGPCRRGTGI